MIDVGETGAGWKMLLFQGVIMVIFDVGFVRLLWIGRKKEVVVIYRMTFILTTANCALY